MQCPVCRVELRMTDRQGIEIDYCPQCRGVWLDRGELDKLIERSASVPSYGEAEHYIREYQRRDDDDYHHHDYRKRKRRSFLGDLFDFD